MLGFPIRTPSDHSLVDNSPRTIAASHVLHRLLMPRHPPCALTHLHTTRCSHPLCNTQHTTTPQPHNHHHTHPNHTTQTNRCNHGNALDGPGQKQPEKTPTPHQQGPTDVSSGPNSVPNSESHHNDLVFHPATPTTHTQNAREQLHRHGIK